MGGRRDFLRGVAATGAVTVFGSTAAGASTQQGSYSASSDLTRTGGVTGQQLDTAIREVSPGSPLVGLGDTWVDVEAEHGINAVYQAAHAAWESAWGRSEIAREKNNIYGWRAYDSSPYDSALGFESKAACVRYVMPRIDDLYLEPDGDYYTDQGPTLSGMNVNYATDPNWAAGIAGVMNSIASQLDTTRQPAFGSGTNVATTGDVNVRSSPAIGDNVTFTTPSGTAGTVVGGPQRADGYIWWQIEYDTGVSGWSVQRYLEEYAGAGGAFTVDQRVATTTDLSVRTGAGTGFDRTAVAPTGSAGYVRDGPRQADGYTWWKVAYNDGYEGWSAGQYLESAPVESEGTFADDQRVSPTTWLTVRRWPGTSYEEVGAVSDGDAGYVRNGPFERDGYTWWKVDWNSGETGWSAELFLESAPLQGEDATFDIGQQVQTTADLSVRAEGTTSADRTAVVPDGTTGYVQDGYVTADGYTWWQIEYETGETGWSAEQYLTGDVSEPQSDFVWPLGGRITSDWYDVREYGYHSSIDIAGTTGEPIVAARSGTVTALEDLPSGGLSVYLDHGDGYTTKYMHCSEFAVSEGESVARGETVAYVGSTGHATGPHLHFELERDGENQFVPGQRGTVVEQGTPIDEEYTGI